MKRPLFIARHAGKPTGVLGRVLAAIMERETAAVNDRAIEALALERADHVLEVGFGHGRSVERIAALVPEGRVAGVDVSEAMTHLALRRNRLAVSEGRVDLRTADVAALPFADAQFDKALTVHTVYFWREPADCLREILRVLRPHGRLVLVAMNKNSGRADNFPMAVYTFYDDREIEQMFERAGFTSVSIERSGDLCIATGTAPAART